MNPIIDRVMAPETQGDVESYAVVPQFVQSVGQFPLRHDPESRFLAFDVDNGATDLEVRIPYEHLPYLRDSINKVLGNAT